MYGNFINEEQYSVFLKWVLKTNFDTKFYKTGVMLEKRNRQKSADPITVILRAAKMI